MRRLLTRFNIRCLFMAVGLFAVALAFYLPTLNAMRFYSEFQQQGDNGNLRWLAQELRDEIQNSPDHRRLMPLGCVNYRISLMPLTLNDCIHFRRRIRLQHHGATEIPGASLTNSANQSLVGMPQAPAGNTIEVLLVSGITRISASPNTAP